MAKMESDTKYKYLEVCIGNEGEPADGHWVGIRTNPMAMPSLRSLRIFLADFIQKNHPGRTVTGFCMSGKREIESNPSVTDLTETHVFGGDIDTNLF